MVGQSRICLGCWEQKRIPIPIRGILSAPFRAVGVRPSRMHPDTCTLCETQFERLMKGRQITIDASVMFADLRGYTSMSQSHSPEVVSEVLDAFYDEAAAAIWAHDGFIIKTMGDAVLAMFNFPLERDDYVKRTVTAARDLQKNWAERRVGVGGPGDALGIGIGLDCGALKFGEFGRAHSDLTAIGTVVNRAARAQAAAAPGEILVTEAVQARCGAGFIDASGSTTHVLKGFDAPIHLWAA